MFYICKYLKNFCLNFFEDHAFKVMLLFFLFILIPLYIYDMIEIHSMDQN